MPASLTLCFVSATPFTAIQSSTSQPRLRSSITHYTIRADVSRTPPTSGPRPTRRAMLITAVLPVAWRLLTTAVSASDAPAPTSFGAAPIAVAPTVTAPIAVTTPATEVATASGLRYYDFRPGNGIEASDGDTVRFHVTTGTTGARNGWKLASTRDGDALIARVGSGTLVPGLDEALRGMRAGGRRRAIVPPPLGYQGSTARGPIPTDFASFQRFKNVYLNTNRPFVPDVVFDIEVLRVQHRNSFN